MQRGKYTVKKSGYKDITLKQLGVGGWSFPECFDAISKLFLNVY